MKDDKYTALEEKYKTVREELENFQIEIGNI